MDKTFVGLALIFFLAFTVFASFVFLNKPLTRLTRASQQTVLATDKTLVFAWPLTVKADGATETTVTVFVRSPDGTGLPNRVVKLNNTFGTTKEPIISSDKDGKAVFHVVSAQQGVAEIEAMVDNIKIPQKVSVKFE